MTRQRKQTTDLFRKSRKSLEDILSRGRLDYNLAKEAIRLAAPILLDWREQIFFNEFKYASLSTMFFCYDPLEEKLKHAYKGYKKCDFSRVLFNYLSNRIRQTKRNNAKTDDICLTMPYSDIIMSFMDKHLKQKIENMPNSTEEYYKSLINKVIKEILDFGYGEIENKMSYYPLGQIFRKYNPLKKKLDSEGPLKKAYVFVQKKNKEKKSFELFLSQFVDDNEQRERIINYPATYDDFARMVFTRHYTKLKEQLAVIVDLYEKRYRRQIRFSYLLRTIDINKDYSQESNPPKPDEKGTFYKIVRHILEKKAYKERIKQNKEPFSNFLFSWFISLFDDEKKKEFIEVTKSNYSKEKHISYLNDILENYCSTCEFLMDKGSYVSLRSYLEGFDPQLPPGRNHVGRQNTPVENKRLRNWMNNKGNFNIVALKYVKDPKLKKRLRAIPSTGVIFRKIQKQKKYAKVLNNSIDDYIKAAQHHIKTKKKVLPLSTYLIHRQKSSKDIREVIYWYSRKKNKINPINSPSLFDVMFADLSIVNKKKIRKIPQNREELFKQAINELVPLYVKWAEQVLNSNEKTIPSLWLFFEKINPVRESGQAKGQVMFLKGRGPWKKVYGFFNSSKKEHEISSFREWVLGQIQNKALREKIVNIPQNAMERDGYLLSRSIELYREHSAYCIYRYLHINRRFDPKPTLSNFLQAEEHFSISGRPKNIPGLRRVFDDYWRIKCRKDKRGESMPELTEWALGLVKEPEKRQKLEELVFYMTSTEPDVQKQAFSEFYPLYLKLCRRSKLPPAKRLMPAEFARAIFPEYYMNEISAGHTKEQ